jgi:hypothetical protein
MTACGSAALALLRLQQYHKLRYCVVTLLLAASARLALS